MGVSRAAHPAARTAGAPPEEGPVTDTAGLAGALAGRVRRPRGSGRRRRLLLYGGVVAAVAVVLAVVLVLDGAHLFAPASKSSGSNPNTPVSYYTDVGSALATARASYWSWPSDGQPALVFAEGLASATLLGPAVNVSHLGAVACAPTLISTPLGSVPISTTAVTSGLAPVWLYAFQATGNTLVVVLVGNGTSAVVATTPTNGDCYDGPGSFTAVPVDSSVAAATASATAESKRYFDNATANASAVSAELLLVPPNYIKTTPAGTDPLWIVTDSTCALYGAASGPGQSLTTVVDAASGKLQTQTTTTVSC